ncbi:MMPL family transporter [Fibrobacter succinogenes]|uniref:MMPL family transporter n=1 Tax=Fibrobacter succinogenes TaxID=833 RepID=UPI00156976C4|nr:MMPL family transporter [Fibrobacter succinogenes]
MKFFNGKHLDAKTGIILWVVIHAILMFLGISVPWKMDSDLYSILPDSDELKNVSAAEKALSARTVRNITVLVGHDNFEVARSAAVALDSVFKDDSSFEETRLFVNEKSMDEIREFFFNHRYTLQGRNVREILAKGDFEALKNRALQKIYGSFSMANLNRLDEDPFLLGDAAFENFVQYSPMTMSRFSIRDSVLYAVDSGVTYVMWNAKLSENVPSMASDGHVIAKMNRVLDSLKLAKPGLIVAKSGVPFHSYESSDRAMSEIAWISGVSIVLILLLLLYVFRSSLPIVATLSTIAIAIFTALAFTWYVFGNIHVFTLVFGTSIIGVSIDYAVHFFVHWKAGVQNVRSSIIKGLLLGFLTTELSYIALSFAEFSLLRQMAVFSIVGLLSAFLTITLLFHAVFENASVFKTAAKSESTNLPTQFPKVFLDAYSKFPKWGVRLILAMFVIALLPGLKLLNVHTDIGNFYTMNEEIKASEALTSKLNNLGVAPSYFIVEGNGENDVLENEEQLTERLANAEKEGLVKAYLAVSNIIPSGRFQAGSILDLEKLVFGIKKRWTEILINNELPQMLAPNVRNYLTEIGVENHSIFVKSLLLSHDFIDFEKIDKNDRFVDVDLKNDFPQSLSFLLQMLWIGHIGDKYYSAVLPLHVSDKFDAQKIAEGLSGVHVVNKKQNINNALTKISQVSLKLVGFAYVVVFFILIIVYKFKDAVRIIRAPVLASLFAASIFGYIGIDFNFFAIVGVILTLGIGIDYALFFKEGCRQNLTTSLAIMLSAMTTIISFGSLACSAFVPIKTFGFVVLLGISCCFLLSPFSRND